MTRIDKNGRKTPTKEGKTIQQKRHLLQDALKNGGPEGTRTPDLLRVKQALYQLSYRSVKLLKRYFIISNSFQLIQLILCIATIISHTSLRNKHIRTKFPLGVLFGPIRRLPAPIWRARHPAIYRANLRTWQILCRRAK